MNLRKKLIICLTVCAVFAGFPSMTLPYAMATPSFNLYNVEPTPQNQKEIDFNTRMTAQGYLVNGKYVMSTATGDIYYYPDYENMFTGGTADDNYIYDEQGRQINLLEWVKDTYLGNYNGGEIVLNSKDDVKYAMKYYQVAYADHQGMSYHYTIESSGKVRFTTEDLKNAGGVTGDDYWEYIRDKASAIDRSQSIKKQVEDVSYLVARSMNYSLDYKNVGVTQAVRDGYGVCFHFTRVMKNILDELGLQSEYMAGHISSSGEMHAWLRVWDSQNGKWIYADATRRYSGLMNGINTEETYDVYFNDYRQCSLDYF